MTSLPVNFETVCPSFLQLSKHTWLIVINIYIETLHGQQDNIINLHLAFQQICLRHNSLGCLNRWNIVKQPYT